jgi:hypothetical protein
MTSGSSDEQGDAEPTAVPPPPIDVSPSATGVVAGDEDEVEEAPPSEEQGQPGS